MNKRQNRLAKIVNILLHHSVGSQEELMALLNEHDCAVTQATLSRDLKTLRTSKVATELGGYRYVIAANGTAADEVATHAMDTVRQAAIMSVARSGPLVVVKTRNGYAGGVAYDIDEIAHPGILGTVAGADTVFVTIATNTNTMEIYDALCSVIPVKIMESAREYFA
ncbi:MAG: hypothetical protein NC043_07750 [Muribaculaceae bacterium]|nr:hypothetical protein [Muribaculaceae bacterium]